MIKHLTQGYFIYWHLPGEEVGIGNNVILWWPVMPKPLAQHSYFVDILISALSTVNLLSFLENEIELFIYHCNFNWSCSYLSAS